MHITTIFSSSPSQIKRSYTFQFPPWQKVTSVGVRCCCKLPDTLDNFGAMFTQRYYNSLSSRRADRYWEIQTRKNWSAKKKRGKKQFCCAVPIHPRRVRKIYVKSLPPPLSPSLPDDACKFTFVTSPRHVFNNPGMRCITGCTQRSGTRDNIFPPLEIYTNTRRKK